MILENVKNSLTHNLEDLLQKSSEEIITGRKDKFLKIGRDQGFVSDKKDPRSLTVKTSTIIKILKSKKVVISIVILLLLLTLFVTII